MKYSCPNCNHILYHNDLIDDSCRHCDYHLPGDEMKIFVNYMILNDVEEQFDKGEISQKEFEVVSNALNTIQNADLNPTIENPLIDRNPPTPKCDEALKNIINRLKNLSGLYQIFGGYIQIVEPVKGDLQEFGMITVYGFDIDFINGLLKNQKEIFLSYIAIPINNHGQLIENPFFDAFDFEEQFVNKVLPITNAIGSFNINEGKTKVRTIKFILDN